VLLSKYFSVVYDFMGVFVGLVNVSNASSIIFLLFIVLFLPSYFFCLNAHSSHLSL
jgi:hypothetical protein